MGGSKRSFTTFNTETKLEERRPSLGGHQAESDPSPHTVVTPLRHVGLPAAAAFPAASSASETSGAQQLLKQRGQARAQMTWSARAAIRMVEMGSESGPSSLMVTPQPSDPLAGADGPEDEDGDSDDLTEKRQQKSQPRRPHLQGRFSGRLETKEDEKRLADECRMLGPFLGGVGKRGEKSRLTLAKIVRGIASGDVRRHCEDRERKLAALQERVEVLEAKRNRQRAGSLQDGVMPVKQELCGRANSFTGNAVPAMSISSSGLCHTAPCQLGQAAMVPRDGVMARATTVDGRLVKSASGGPVVLMSGPPAVATASSVPHPATPAQTSRSAASEAKALAHEAAQLKAQAQNFKAHADHLQEQSQQALSEPVQIQAAVQAQSFQAKAQSLEKAAEAQNLQAQAVAHAQAQADAHAHAQHLAAKAHVHAQAHMEAAAQVHHLKSAAQYDGDHAQEAVAQAQQLEAKAQGHAQAQSQLVVHAHNLTAKAHAHANAQAQAQAQAQQAAEEACHLDAAAQQLQAEAHLVASKGSMIARQHQPDQPYARISASVAGSKSDVQQGAIQQRERLVVSMQPKANHLPSCPPLQGTALGMPHSELDDTHLILAAAEVRYEHGAAMAVPQPSLPDSRDGLFKGSQQEVVQQHQEIQHHGLPQGASAAVQLAASVPGQHVQTAIAFEQRIDSVQQVGTVLQSVPSAMRGSLSASPPKMLPFFDGGPHASVHVAQQDTCTPGQRGLPSHAVLMPADTGSHANTVEPQAVCMSYELEPPAGFSISLRNEQLAPIVTLQGAPAGGPLSTPKKSNADAACRIDFLSHI